jgi:hypothetical protein
MRCEAISFKSVPENFVKERDGLKPNTVRVVATNDPRFEALDQRTAKVIEIINTDTGEFFQRMITDISFWDGRFIISWEHAQKEKMEEIGMDKDEIVKALVAIISKGENPDSLEIGTAGKGGSVKVYGNYDDPAAFKKKIDAAMDCRAYAQSKIPQG